MISGRQRPRAASKMAVISSFEGISRPTASFARARFLVSTLKMMIS